MRIWKRVFTKVKSNMKVLDSSKYSSLVWDAEDGDTANVYVAGGGDVGTFPSISL